MKTIRPHSIHWPAAFWKRAESSYTDNDLVCTDCDGRGYAVSRLSAWPGITLKDVACLACRGSGLLVRASRLSSDLEAIWAAEEAGAGWLEWAWHTGDGLLWPTPWAWTISRRRFNILRNVYVGGDDVLAYMDCGSVVVGLYDLGKDGRGRLERVFRMACGGDAEVPGFGMPASQG
jgi:hypothetical protein